MRVVSVNVGLPREIFWKGRTVQTGIFKGQIARRQEISYLFLGIGDKGLERDLDDVVNTCAPVLHKGNIVRIVLS